MIRQFSAVLAVTAFLTHAALAQLEFFDGLLDSADWTVTQLSFGSGGTYAVEQRLTGGNPDEYRWLSLDINAGSGDQGVVTIHINDTFTYSPMAQGAIDSISFSMSARYFGGYGGNTNGGQGVSFVLEQGGVWFTSQQGFQPTQCSCWQDRSYSGLREDDFVAYPGGGGHPDFSADAPDIRVGFYAGNSAGGFSGVFGRTQGYDNFHAIFTPERPVITNHPDSLLLPVGGGVASFELTATGAPPLAYQWQRDGIDLVNGGNISGADTNTLQVIATATDVGLYECVVTNDLGTAISDAAILAVRPGCPGDFNGDTLINTSDVIDFLNAWNAGCP